MKDTLEILYEDNHVIAVNKKASDIVQGDKTGDVTLPDRIKEYLKEKYQKPGNVFCGVIHRLDRPTSGVVLFARTSKALERLNKQFREKETNKVYWAVTENEPTSKTGTLINYLKKNEGQNKSYVHSTEVPGSKKAVLNYKLIASSDNYFLLEIQLETGRHHQIRAQLSSIGCPIKGDVKYGAKRPNKDLSISLHARELSFMHPTTKEQISITAPVPEDPLWKYFAQELNCNQ
ncbi:MAG: RluA family pseudouridine synthase [Bacteroidetes bacterium]|nr:MAG: RluA family pseudouridine synthase [Bacteroidota bacterium]